MTVPRQRQYSLLDDQMGDTVFATNFYASESFVFATILVRQKK